MLRPRWSSSHYLFTDSMLLSHLFATHRYHLFPSLPISPPPAPFRIHQGEVYCHRRTSTKRVFPSMYDMFIGGVSGTMEPAATTALRELGEELGLGPCASGSGVENRGGLCYVGLGWVSSVEGKGWLHDVFRVCSSPPRPGFCRYCCAMRLLLRGVGPARYLSATAAPSLETRSPDLWCVAARESFRKANGRASQRRRKSGVVLTGEVFSLRHANTSWLDVTRHRIALHAECTDPIKLMCSYVRIHQP